MPLPTSYTAAALVKLISMAVSVAILVPVVLAMHALSWVLQRCCSCCRRQTTTASQFDEPETLPPVLAIPIGARIEACVVAASVFFCPIPGVCFTVRALVSSLVGVHQTTENPIPLHPTEKSTASSDGTGTSGDIGGRDVLRTQRTQRRRSALWCLLFLFCGGSTAGSLVAWAYHFPERGSCAPELTSVCTCRLHGCRDACIAACVACRLALVARVRDTVCGGWVRES